GIAALFLFIPHARPEYFVNRGDAFYLTNQATTTSSNELLPLWVKQLPLSSPPVKVAVAAGKVTDLFYNSNKITFSLDSPKSETIRINTIYYPGWEFSVDGIKTAVNYHNQFGVMDVRVLAGRHVVQGEFSETPLRLFSDFVSLFSVLVLAIYSVYSLVYKFKKK
ncbi:MAG: hypothetical protein ABSD69_03175, partial [Candidatus Levyibacteriota bacterium]